MATFGPVTDEVNRKRPPPCLRKCGSAPDVAHGVWVAEIDELRRERARAFRQLHNAKRRLCRAGKRELNGVRPRRFLGVGALRKPIRFADVIERSDIVIDTCDAFLDDDRGRDAKFLCSCSDVGILRRVRREFGDHAHEAGCKGAGRRGCAAPARRRVGRRKSPRVIAH